MRGTEELRKVLQTFRIHSQSRNCVARSPVHIWLDWRYVEVVIIDHHPELSGKL
jgi:hypothetical protein